MKIELVRLQLQNFKGIRTLDVKFRKVTNIFGDNATGKTTIFDAFLWLFFGKDSTDRKDFNIKTLGPDNEPFHKLDHEVTADILVDGVKVTIRRLYQENWTTQKGGSQQKMAGHVQSFFWNDVPLKLEEFQTKVSGILPEAIFKLITNTGYFNNMKWQDRRSTLLDLAGEITDNEVMSSLGDKVTPINRVLWDALFKNLNQGKTIDEYQREIAVKKKKIKDELQLLPARIDEANRALPEEQDYDQIESQIKEYQDDLELVEAHLMSSSKAEKARQEQVTAKLRQVQTHRSRMQEIEFEAKVKVQDQRHVKEEAVAEARRQLRSQESELSSVSRERSQLQLRKDEIATRMKNGRAAWATINAEKLEFKEGQFCCPTCKQDLPTDQVAGKKKELTENFNKDKSRRLEENVSLGKTLSVEAVEAGTRIEKLAQREQDLQTDINRLKQQVVDLDEAVGQVRSKEVLEIQRAIASNEEHLKNKQAIEALEEEINAPQDGGEKETKDRQQSRKKMLEGQLLEQRNLLATRKIRETGQLRIKELTRQESELSATLSDLEGIEYSIQQFTRAKMDLLESRINGRFKVVKFKLFEQQINGGEAPCCETLVKGVPYSDANTASKINAGLDIINTLCAHYQAYAPVFVDNAESVNTLIPVGSQLIRLVVTRDKKLKIDAPQEELFETETA